MDICDSRSVQVGDDFVSKIEAIMLSPELPKKKLPISQHAHRNFPGGAVLKNPPANAGDVGLSPGLGRFHMPWSN